MAYAVVQAKQVNSATTASTFTATFTASNLVLGNRIIVFANGYSGGPDSTTTVTDGTNTYNQHDFSSTSITCGVIASFVVTAGLAGTKPTISVNWKLAGAAQSIGSGAVVNILEVSGLNATNGSGALDGVVAHTVRTSQTGSPAAVTMASNSGASSEFVLGLYADEGNGSTIVNPFGTTDLHNDPTSTYTTSTVCHKDSTSGTAETGSWSWAGGSNNQSAVYIAVFKLASATTASGADSIAVTNAATKLALATANDPVVITDAATKLALAAPNDSLVISESASVGGGNTPTGADSIAVTDAPTQIGLSPSDSLAVTDAGSNVMLAAADSIAVTDAASGLSPAVTDAIALTDAPTQIDLTPGASIPGTQGGGSAYAQTPYASTPYAGASTSTPSSPGGGTESITVFEAGVPSTSTFVSASDAITITDVGAVIVGAFIVMPTLAVLEVMPVNSVTLEAMPVTVAVLEVSPAK